MPGKLRILATVILLAALPPAFAAAPINWVASWATSQQTPEPRNALADEAMTDATLRQTVHLSLGGKSWRLKLSNAFGQAPLRVGAVRVARAVAPGSPAIEGASDTRVLFDGREDVIIPPGADYLSDAFSFDAASASNISISLYLPLAPKGQTSHPGSRTTTHLVHGNQVSAAKLEGTTTVEHWFVIAGLDVAATAKAAAIVVLGDSIADGRGTTTNGNDRWSDDLAARLLKAKLPLAVLNHGIGGNRLLDDGLGPNVLARLDRDVLAQSGARYLIVHEGVNDLGTFITQPGKSDADHETFVARMIGAYRQIIERARARGIKVIGAPITPFDGPTYHPDARGEADRAAINAWIRTAGHFDAVVDFDKAVRDPQHPTQFIAAYDSGDHLHLSPKGYQAMADAIPLSLFAESR